MTRLWILAGGALAFTISEFLAYLERRVSYYAAKR